MLGFRRATAVGLTALTVERERWDQPIPAARASKTAPTPSKSPYVPATLSLVAPVMSGQLTTPRMRTRSTASPTSQFFSIARRNNTSSREVTGRRASCVLWLEQVWHPPGQAQFANYPVPPGDLVGRPPQARTRGDDPDAGPKSNHGTRNCVASMVVRGIGEREREVGQKSESATSARGEEHGEQGELRINPALGGLSHSHIEFARSLIMKR